jgi:hypothetical protein
MRLLARRMVSGLIIGSWYANAAKVRLKVAIRQITFLSLTDS